MFVRQSYINSCLVLTRFRRAEINEAKSASTKSFVTALVFNAIVFGVEIGVFTLIRPYFKAIYEPRTYAPAPSYVTCVFRAIEEAD